MNKSWKTADYKLKDAKTARKANRQQDSIVQTAETHCNATLINTM